LGLEHGRELAGLLQVRVGVPVDDLEVELLPERDAGGARDLVDDRQILECVGLDALPAIRARPVDQDPDQARAHAPALIRVLLALWIARLEAVHHESPVREIGRWRELLLREVVGGPYGAGCCRQKQPSPVSSITAFG